MFAKQLTEGRQRHYVLSKPVRPYGEKRGSRYVVVSRSNAEAERFTPREFMVFMATPEGRISSWSEVGVSYTSYEDALRDIGVSTVTPI